MVLLAGKKTFCVCSSDVIQCICFGLLYRFFALLISAKKLILPMSAHVYIIRLCGIFFPSQAAKPKRGKRCPTHQNPMYSLHSGKNTVPYLIWYWLLIGSTASLALRRSDLRDSAEYMVLFEYPGIRYRRQSSNHLLPPLQAPLSETSLAQTCQGCPSLFEQTLFEIQMHSDCKPQVALGRLQM